jgi:uncharacterized membrane protein required for colicin V production
MVEGSIRAGSDAHWEETMATSHTIAPGAATTTERSFRPALSFIVCACVVALAMASLWTGLSGLMNPDHAGGLLRTLGGFVGFFVVFGLTLVAAARQK